MPGKPAGAAQPATGGAQGDPLAAATASPPQRAWWQRVPLRFAMRAISLDPGRIREWLAAPAAPPETPGWKVPQLAGPAGWVTGLRRSKAA